MLLGIDIGTTHLKAGLFTASGDTLEIAACPHLTMAGWGGISSYDPDSMWENIKLLIYNVCKGKGQMHEPLQAVGIAGMAETGLLVNRTSGKPRTPFVPWFENCASEQVGQVKSRIEEVEFFLQTGLHAAAKYSLMKLLWLKERDPDLLFGAVWLSAADWIAYQMCGVMQTDFTLAERTGAFNIEARNWNEELLANFGLGVDLFPPAGASGLQAGESKADLEAIGIPRGTPVGVSGHDHVCGAWAARSTSAIQPAPVFDSMGTAEAFIGMFSRRTLSEKDFRAGFSFGLACDPDELYWQGGLSASGGSLAWLSTILAEPPLDYAALEALAAGASSPTGILYYPYLAGSGSPHSDSAARGAFFGLNAAHTRADLCRAVLEGCAYEMEYQRRRAVELVNAPAEYVIAAGGGTRNRLWMQIKADVFGCPVEILEQEETTLLGAALLAGRGAGALSSRIFGQMQENKPKQRVEPDPKRSRTYRTLFEQGFLAYEGFVRAVRTAA